MISDQEWDEMRVAARLRLSMLRDEIRTARRGNREDALQGVRDAFRQGPVQDSGGDWEDFDPGYAEPDNQEYPNNMGVPTQTAIPPVGPGT